jgi:two-component system, cell cycle sensor histidine kinase and response regulator CckA
VYGIIKQSGGHVWVYSEPAQGTALKVYLPTVKESVKRVKTDTRSPQEPCGSETILVVEDQQTVRRLVCQALGISGHEVLEAANAGEAMLICEHHGKPIHLMLTDVVLPQLSRRELAGRVKQCQPQMKVL